jgi:uncharacterized protein (TIGR04255 family)
MQGRQYKNPPIEEALVEVHFRPSHAWDWTVPGRLWLKLRGTYAGSPGSQGIAFSQSQISGVPVGGGAAVTRVLLRSADSTRIVGLGENVLSVHALRPYHGWDEFRQKIVEALGAYWELESPAGVDRVLLRYINKIPLPREGSLDLTRYFTLGPQLPGEPAEVSQFLTRVQATIDDHTTVVLTMACGPDAQREAVLDFQLFCVPGEMRPPETLETIDRLRAQERRLFEAAITDEARGLFDQ